MWLRRGGQVACNNNSYDAGWACDEASSLVAPACSQQLGTDDGLTVSSGLSAVTVPLHCTLGWSTSVFLSTYYIQRTACFPH